MFGLLTSRNAAAIYYIWLNLFFIQQTRNNVYSRYTQRPYGDYIWSEVGFDVVISLLRRLRTVPNCLGLDWYNGSSTGRMPSLTPDYWWLQWCSNQRLPSGRRALYPLHHGRMDTVSICLTMALPYNVFVIP
jgi:hypothetical protein